VRADQAAVLEPQPGLAPWTGKLEPEFPTIDHNRLR
jgi:hypothetical protein